jgi:hypothetical protein
MLKFSRFSVTNHQSGETIVMLSTVTQNVEQPASSQHGN